MLPNFPELHLLAGTPDYEFMPQLGAHSPFSKMVCLFLDELSKSLFKHPLGRSYTDLVTFAFFCRKANLAKLAQHYADYSQFALGRGVTFHIAPSNVPINFAYSLVAGLLAGNACIVRVSSKDFPQVNIIATTINALLKQAEFSALKPYIAIVKYPRDSAINNALSRLCDVRIIWGGDRSIAEIRTSPLHPRAYDITFADRYSLCIINAEHYLANTDKEQIALDFYNDTYLFDQNACSSPRLIYWLGANDLTNPARDLFWQKLQALLSKKNYTVDAITVINKHTTACRLALECDEVKIVKSENNLINRVSLQTLSHDWMKYTCPGGYYLEYCSTSTSQLLDGITKKTQTLTYIGFDKQALWQLVQPSGIQGIDRIVPCGKAADFNLIWDGHDLIRQMSRTVYCE